MTGRVLSLKPAVSPRAPARRSGLRPAGHGACVPPCSTLTQD